MDEIDHATDAVRGVVDFIHLGNHFYNIADFFIIGGTPLFLLAAAYQGVRAAMRPAAATGTPIGENTAGENTAAGSPAS